MQYATSLIKALDVLTLLSGSRDGLRMAEVAESIHLPRSSVVRIINTLVMQGFVARVGMRYRVTDQFAHWATKDRYAHLRRRYRSVLEFLGKATGELVLLGVQDGAGVVHIDYIESDQTIRVAPSPLTHHTIRHNALGKLCLAQRPDLAEKWIQAEPAFAEELKTIRKRGVAWNREETVKGMIALAAYGFSRAPYDAKIAIAWPASRFTEKKGKEAESLLVKCPSGF